MINYLIIGCMAVLFLVCIVMIFNRSMALERFGVLELVLAASIAVSMVFGFRSADRHMADQYLELFSVYVQAAYPYLENLEQSAWEEEDAKSSLQELLEQTLPVTTADGLSRQFLSAAVLRRDGAGSYQEWFSCGENGSDWSLVRNTAAELIPTAVQSRRVEAARLPENRALFVLADRSVITPSYALSVEIPLDPLVRQEQALKQEFLFAAVFLLVFGTLVSGAVILIQDRELRRVIRFTAGAVEGKEDWSLLAAGGEARSNEMRSLCNSLYQMSTDAARTSYLKYKALQAYCRFAPKEIERILGRQSILDVQPEDNVRLCAAVAFLSYNMEGIQDEAGYVKQLNRNYEVLGSVREEYGGIVVSAGSDLSTLQVLFREEMEKALRFGLDLAAHREDGREHGVFILLHRAPFVYGVAGDENQTFPYVHSRELKILERHIDEIRSLNVHMAVTDYVYEAVGQETRARYIGFIEDSGCRFRLYEILDACPAKERQSRIDTEERFEKALNLFYQGDFYLARNVFSEVLKDSPSDRVAKRYLFLCEHCLSGGGEHTSYGLFPDKR